MPIETATYIKDLVVTNPAGSDPVSNAADHLRLIKKVLKDTFPNLDGPVNFTAAQMNAGAVPTGTIVMWYGAKADIPAGWAPCDGGTYDRLDGSGSIVAPNLQDKFVRCPSASTAQGSTGGSATHKHSGRTGGTAISQAQMPFHSHGVSDPGHGHTGWVSDPGHDHGFPNASAGSWTSEGGTNGGAVYTFPTGRINATNRSGTGISVGANTNWTGISIQGTGGNQSHDHDYSAMSDGNNIPPYTALWYIMKL